MYCSGAKTVSNTRNTNKFLIITTKFMTKILIGYILFECVYSPPPEFDSMNLPTKENNEKHTHTHTNNSCLRLLCICFHTKSLLVCYIQCHHNYRLDNNVKFSSNIIEAQTLIITIMVILFQASQLLRYIYYFVILISYFFFSFVMLMLLCVDVPAIVWH